MPGGQTIHSFFRIEPSLYTPGDRRLREKAPEGDPDRSTVYDLFPYTTERLNLIRELELLVIDEVSMVRADLLDVVDTLLRIYRKNSLPFGGVQVIFIGDVFQLPPVINAEEEYILHKYYDSGFFFSANVFKRSKPLYIELKKIYRQSDKDFIDILNRVRVGSMLPTDFQKLNARYKPNFYSTKDKYIFLAATNSVAYEVNTSKLEELISPLYAYQAYVDGDFPLESRPTDTELYLKVGAQVMFVKNNWQKHYYNGMIGTVTEIKENSVVVEVKAGKGESGIIEAGYESWQNKKYFWDEKEKNIVEKIVGTFSQIPLRLAWAITVHKSQGMTFEKVIVDIENAFASGQAYVALSRCTSMEGLVLASRLTRESVKTDSRVLKFAEQETSEAVLKQILQNSSAESSREDLKETRYETKKTAFKDANYAIGSAVENDAAAEEIAAFPARPTDIELRFGYYETIDENGKPVVVEGAPQWISVTNGDRVYTASGNKREFVNRRHK